MVGARVCGRRPRWRTSGMGREDRAGAAWCAVVVDGHAEPWRTPTGTAACKAHTRALRNILIRWGSCGNEGEQGPWSPIDIADDFSRFAAGLLREKRGGVGAAFRDLLKAALKNAEKVEVVFDGIASFGSSFLEEVFGGLVRK